MTDKIIVAAVDFDGTVAKWDTFPNIGPPVPHAVDVLKRMSEQGIAIILWTIRDGRALDKAIFWCKERGIDIYSTNIRPYQTAYSVSPKVDADFYIDDKAIGTPLIRPKVGRPYVNWIAIDKLLKIHGYIK